MKKYIFKSTILAAFALLTTVFTSCESDSNDEKKNEIQLVEHGSKVMGRGKGGRTTDCYLGLSEGNGGIISFLNVDKNDEATQTRVDIVFPGDAGSSGGGLTVGAPISDGLGGAGYEYCKEWIRKNGTKIAEMPNSFDLTAFENVKTVPQILELDKKAFYSSWQYPGTNNGGQGKTLLIKTYTGHLALMFIERIQGSYGDTQAKVTIRLKVTPNTH